MNPYNKIIHGDVLESMKTLPDSSVDCVITSPPYWRLRDYGWAGQWGLEPTYQEYLEHLWQLMDEVKRVLKDTGTAWVNLGDMYSASGRGGGSDKMSEMQLANVGSAQLANLGFKKPPAGMPSKCLLLIPHRFAIGCIDRGWIMRNDIIWAKRNVMPESVTDRFSKKHEYIFFMVKSERYYFDMDEIRDKCKPLNKWGGPVVKDGSNSAYCKATGMVVQPNNGMKNPGDVSDFWDITTKPSKQKHYATYNSELIDKPIIAGCPAGGIVLDPFCGTGTTLARAAELGRKYIGIEGKAEYVEIAMRATADAGVML